MARREWSKYTADAQVLFRNELESLCAIRRWDDSELDYPKISLGIPILPSGAT